MVHTRRMRRNGTATTEGMFVFVVPCLQLFDHIELQLWNSESGTHASSNSSIQSQLQNLVTPGKGINCFFQIAATWTKWKGKCITRTGHSLVWKTENEKYTLTNIARSPGNPLTTEKNIFVHSLAACFRQIVFQKTLQYQPWKPIDVRKQNNVT